MERDKLTQRLLRILRAVDAGEPPARVREVYVFGSYARGALAPADLDLVIVHDRPSKDYEDKLAAEFDEKGLGITEAVRRGAARFRSDMLRALRRPGERADFLLADTIEHVVGAGSKIRQEDLILLWSEADRDYESKVRSIVIDPTAGRAARNHLVSLKRLVDPVRIMETAVDMVADGRLTLTRFPVAAADAASLNARHAARLALWRTCGLLGRRSLEPLSLGIWWMQLHRQRCQCPHRTEMYSETWTHRVHFGRPSIGRMLGIFESRPKVRRQCLIPHLSRSEPNELLAFERGPKWNSSGAGADRECAHGTSPWDCGESSNCKPHARIPQADKIT